MTAEIVSLCRFDGCRRAAAFPGQARCEDHRLRWIAGASPERKPTFVPEWRRRLTAKDFTGSAA